MRDETNLGRWYLIPTVGKNPYQQKSYYRSAQCIEPGRAAIEELREALVEEHLKTENFADADAVIASIKAGL